MTFLHKQLYTEKNIADLLQILKLERGRLLNARKIFKKTNLNLNNLLHFFLQRVGKNIDFSVFFGDNIDFAVFCFPISLKDGVSVPGKVNDCNRLARITNLAGRSGLFYQMNGVVLRRNTRRRYSSVWASGVWAWGMVVSRLGGVGGAAQSSVMVSICE